MKISAPPSKKEKTEETEWTGRCRETKKSTPLIKKIEKMTFFRRGKLRKTAPLMGLYPQLG